MYVCVRECVGVRLLVSAWLCVWTRMLYYMCVYMYYASICIMLVSVCVRSRM
jgi:hypothetical protein